MDGAHQWGEARITKMAYDALYMYLAILGVFLVVVAVLLSVRRANRDLESYVRYKLTEKDFQPGADYVTPEERLKETK